MPPFRLVFLVLLLAGCRRPQPVPKVAFVADGQIVHPDSSVVPGVLTLTHSAGAFARAIQYTLDSVPLVVFDGGTNGDFDLTQIFRPLLLADGRLLAAQSFGNGWLMLFNADGTPARVIARSGDGPGDVRSPIAPIALTADTVLVIDGNTHRVNWVTANDGIVRSAPLQSTVPPFCFQDPSLLPAHQLLASNGCIGTAPIDQPTRPPVDVVVMGLAFSAPDTIAHLPGLEMIPFETRYHGVRRIEPLRLRFGEMCLVAAWDTGFVSATGEGGYMLERRALDGHVTARILVQEPRRPVTAAMRDAQIGHELDQLTGPQAEEMADATESRREARAVPFADSLPPYGRLFPAPDGILWVSDYAAPADSSWSATAFRSDGAIVGRLTAHLKSATPVSFGKDRVLVRLVGEDGVVRFAEYRLSTRHD
jgi:hypothetical protein